MKLNEIRGSNSLEKNITITLGDYDDIELVVRYGYTPASTTRHGDNHTFDERHPAEFEIYSIKLAQDVEVVDEDGNVTEIVPAGSDVSELPGVDAGQADADVMDELEEPEEDFDEPDDDGDDGGDTSHRYYDGT